MEEADGDRLKNSGFSLISGKMEDQESTLWAEGAPLFSRPRAVIRDIGRKLYRVTLKKALKPKGFGGILSTYQVLDMHCMSEPHTCTVPEKRLSHLTMICSPLQPGFVLINLEWYSVTVNL